MKKIQELYSGKAKTLYITDSDDLLIMLFRNDTSAFDGQKIAQLKGKGRINNLFNAYIMQLLEANGINTGFERVISDNESIVKKLDMLPIECVVRNYAAGSIVRRYGIKPGQEFCLPLFEMFLKNDGLHDPLVNSQHVTVFGWASEHEVKQMQEISSATNKILSNFFEKKGLILVDFKLEFGRFQNKLYVGDEFSPDGCRIWDRNTREVYDKDIFRHGLGDLLTGYSKAAEKLGIDLSAN